MPMQNETILAGIMTYNSDGITAVFSALCALLDMPRDVIAANIVGKEKPWFEGLMVRSNLHACSSPDSKETWLGAAFSRLTQAGTAQGMNFQLPLFEINGDSSHLIWGGTSYDEVASTAQDGGHADDRLSDFWLVWESKNLQLSPRAVENDGMFVQGVDEPGHNTTYATAFKVRSDGKSHHMSYMQVPQIPVFVNSPIADA
ncbi:hypothetical protein FB567DRAFT_592938 [Paraphoma chrysanthemicola]|uniref:Uncharacterized protein n=1 Tax=Paraphoma chrysanthemicola TaxID=798071 RepID=A0A8K0R826_9PLEO|nr:hypothetical protein FB567DRAFT_592938 [Paraphoma chrysanthemicola]